MLYASQPGPSLRLTNTGKFWWLDSQAVRNIYLDSAKPKPKGCV
jgi:hypothetical protein